MENTIIIITALIVVASSVSAYLQLRRKRWLNGLTLMGLERFEFTATTPINMAGAKFGGWLCKWQDKNGELFVSDVAEAVDGSMTIRASRLHEYNYNLADFKPYGKVVAFADWKQLFSPAQ